MDGQKKRWQTTETAKEKKLKRAESQRTFKMRAQPGKLKTYFIPFETWLGETLHKLQEDVQGKGEEAVGGPRSLPKRLSEPLSSESVRRDEWIEQGGEQHFLPEGHTDSEKQVEGHTFYS